MQMLRQAKNTEQSYTKSSQQSLPVMNQLAEAGGE